MTKCRTTTRGDLSIERCLDGAEVTYIARRGRDEVALALAEAHQGTYMVTGIQVDDKAQRSGIGTRLYEQLTADACELGLPLVSDEMRSHFAEAFWRKQETKGRVRCIPGKGEVFVGPLASLKRRLADGRISREEFERKTKGLPTADGDGPGTWACSRYEIARPCAHSKLDGVKRGAKRKRRR